MDEVYGIYFAEHWISVDPSVDYDETLEKVNEVVNGYPGLYRDVQTYLKERIREVLTGSSHPIVVRVYGQDLATLRELAHEVEAKLLEIEELTEVHVELLVDVPQIEIDVDLERANFYGLSPGDIRRQAAFLIAGLEAGDIHTPSRTYDVQVWTSADQRDSLTDLENLLIDTPDGGYVRLIDVADVVIAPIPNGIYHENLARRLDIDANLKDDSEDLGSAVRAVEEALQTINFPVGYHAELKGEYAERQAASNRILGAGIVATLVIFFLLRVSLGNWRLAIMSFLSLPMAVVGGILAAYIASEGILSLGSLVGFLTILGIAARNGIMLISHYQHLEEQEGVPFGLDLVLRGARERIAPILMTALTAGLALAPLVIAGDIPGHEIEHPMAIVILGGLVTSTLVNLFIVPSLYLQFGKTQVAH
jgi:Cu/Ag efflux pump CusA